MILKIIFLMIYLFLISSCADNNKESNKNKDVVDTFDRSLLSDIDTANSGSCAIYDKQIFCWGSNLLTNESYIADNSGIKISELNLSTPTKISIGDLGSHACVLDQGNIKCWGVNDDQQLNVPASLASTQNIQMGWDYGCGLAENSVLCWGDTIVDNLSNLEAPFMLSSNNHVTCALDEMGVYCASLVNEGSYREGLSNPTFIDSGFYHTCVIDNREVKCWSTIATNLDQDTPIINDAVSLAIGHSHGCAILLSNSIECWADDPESPVLADIPVVVNPVKITAGNNFSCVIDDNGVACWGENDSGQLNVPEFLSSIPKT